MTGLNFQNIRGPLLRVQKSEFRCLYKCSFLNLVHDGSNSYSLLDVFNGILELSSSSLEDINLLSQDVKSPIITVHHSTLELRQTEIRRFEGRLVHAF